MTRVGGLLAALVLGACATDAPDTPSRYPPTVKPAPSKLTFEGMEPCEELARRFETTKASEGYYAKQAAVLHYEQGFATIVMLGVNLLALNQATTNLAIMRGDMIALHDEMGRRACPAVPEVAFSTPSARTPGSLYH